MGVPKDHLKLLDELHPKGVLDTKSSRMEGPVDQHLMKAFLYTKAVNRNFEQGFHE